MFPAKNRLRTEKDIKALFAKGRSVFDLAIGMRFSKPHTKDSRFAVAVGTKISKKAVVRNRLRRRIRGVVEDVLPSLNSGFDVLFLVKKETIDLTTDQLREQIIRLLKKAKIYES